MERRHARSVLLEDVREYPVGERIHRFLRILDLVQDEGGLVILVVHWVRGCVGGTPLGEVQFQVGQLGSAEQLARVDHAAAHGRRIGIEHGAFPAGLIDEALFDAIGVRGYEIDRHVVGGAKLHQRGLEPVRNRGSGTADPVIG